MGKTNPKVVARRRRKKRFRNKLLPKTTRPRLCVYRSNKHMFAQVVNDENSTVLVAMSTSSRELAGSLEKTGNLAAAKRIGELIGKKALEKNIKKVVFDRNGFIFHGRVKALADGAREAGLEF
jgi:large subunit ribosomal protein L18